MYVSGVSRAAAVGYGEFGTAFWSHYYPSHEPLNEFVIERMFCYYEFKGVEFMLHDRGIKKWQGLMIREHVENVHQAIEDLNKVEKPILEEDKLNEIEVIIAEAMEFNNVIEYKIYQKGYYKYLLGRTIFIDYINKNFRVIDTQENVHSINFKDIIDVKSI